MGSAVFCAIQFGTNDFKHHNPPSQCSITVGKDNIESVELYTPRTKDSYQCMLMTTGPRARDGSSKATKNSSDVQDLFEFVSAEMDTYVFPMLFSLGH